MVAYGFLVGLWVGVMAFLVACGDDGDGNEDTLLTGFSGFVILVLAVWGVWKLTHRSKG